MTPNDAVLRTDRVAVRDRLRLGNRTNLPPLPLHSRIEARPDRRAGRPDTRTARDVGRWELLRATPGVGVALNSVNVRRRPTLPRPPGRSTIGAVGLNFQVRNGDWVFPRRYGHRNSIEISTNHSQATTHGGLGVDRIPGTVQ